MSSWGYYSPPDDPARRIVWVLPLAVALVLLAMTGLGRFLRLTATPRRAPLPPVQAQIYELPAHPGVIRPRAVHPHPHPASVPSHASPAPRRLVARPTPQPAVPKQVRARPTAHVHLPTTPLLKLPTTRLRKPRRVPVAKAVQGPPSVARAVPLHPEKRAPALPALDLGQLGEQIASAAASTLSDSEYQQVRDPHTLVAHYYLAAVLRKLHRVGEMTYLGTRIGENVVMLIIGPEGELDSLQLYSSSGDQKLDDYALRIVRLSAPFPAFPASLERQTQRLKLVVRMDFEGYREVDAE